MTKEQVENIQDAARSSQSSEDGDDKRERSTIQFPYNDLDDAVAIAKAVYENAGISCAIDQLAAYVKILSQAELFDCVSQTPPRSG